MYIQELIFDRDKRIYLIAVLISLLLHIVIYLMVNFNFLLIDWGRDTTIHKEPVTVIFPENKPKMIVENINENNERPNDTDLLSDRNSRARNPDIRENISNQPASNGNSPLENLTKMGQSGEYLPLFSTKKFSRDALSIDRNKINRHDLSTAQNEQELSLAKESREFEETTNTNLRQQKFSADQLGGLTLSTYAWEWAPYINAMKRKLHQVWYAPPAYSQLGLIKGQTTIQYVISRDGNLVKYDVLDHQGHESLLRSSINAIESLFPFKPLPSNFPDETLTIRAILIYPDLRERR
jgi:outer membrane biosynthesis protein TonB